MKISRKIDPRYRSLLQKAVRRGHANLVMTLSSLIGLLGPVEKRWFSQQTAIMAFRMCWPLAPGLNYTRHFHSRVAAMAKVARSVKNQDAAGLGAMAHAFYKGDFSVLDDSANDRIIRIVSSGIERPDDFWAWVDDGFGDGADERNKSGQQSILWPRGKNATLFDRAVIHAAAYLAMTTDPPTLSRADSEDDRFPYWVAFDHHTREGRRVLIDISRDLHIPLSQLRWILFYFEGSRTQKRVSSVWWDRYCRWRFKKAGLVPEQAHLIWQSARPQLMAALAEDARHLHREIYRWKKAHLDQVNDLKTKVAPFLSSPKRLADRQKPLF
jgi:hypothetical protein